MPDYQGARRRVPLRERMDSILGRLPETTRTAMSPLLGGPQGVGLLDVLPGTGEALAAADYSQAREQGDRLGAGIAALGVVPVVGAAGRGARIARNVPRITAYHGSSVGGITRLARSKRGPLGPGAYLSPHQIVARRYGENLYEAELPRESIFNGLGHMGDSSINPYEVWRAQNAALRSAADPALQSTLSDLGTRTGPDDGYGFYTRLVQTLGSHEAAQDLIMRAGFSGISGWVDGPEVAMFRPVPVKETRPWGTR